jgi:hypothetical protein
MDALVQLFQEERATLEGRSLLAIEPRAALSPASR